MNALRPGVGLWRRSPSLHGAYHSPCGKAAALLSRRHRPSIVARGPRGSRLRLRRAAPAPQTGDRLSFHSAPTSSPPPYRPAGFPSAVAAGSETPDSGATAEPGVRVMPCIEGIRALSSLAALGVVCLSTQQRAAFFLHAFCLWLAHLVLAAIAVGVLPPPIDQPAPVQPRAAGDREGPAPAAESPRVDSGAASTVTQVGLPTPDLAQPPALRARLGLAKQRWKHDIDDAAYNSDPILTEGLAGLRPYQHRLLALLIRHFTTEGTALLSMACGTGKTIVMAALALRYDLVLTFSPWVPLNAQNNVRVTRMTAAPCSARVDHESLRDADQILAALGLLGTPATASGDDGTGAKAGPRVLSSTFDSAPIVLAAMKRLEASGWGGRVLICVDESHVLTPEGAASDQALREILRGRRVLPHAHRLGVTATPRFERSPQQPEAEGEGEGGLKCVLDHAMLKAQFFGAVTASYSLTEAINDTSIVPPAIHGVEIDVGGCGGVRTEAGLKRWAWMAALSIARAMVDLGSSKALIFLGRQAEIVEVSKALPVALRGLAGGTVWTGRASSLENSASGEAVPRAEVLRDFARNGEDRSALFAIHVLAHGIDIPCADLVVIKPPAKLSAGGAIETVQKLSRGQRPYPRKTRNNVLLLLEPTPAKKARGHLEHVFGSIKDFLPNAARFLESYRTLVWDADVRREIGQLTRGLLPPRRST